MVLYLILLLTGILGFVLNIKNIILMLISVKIMFSTTILLGQIYAIYIIAIAGGESPTELGLLVAFYRLRGSFTKEFK